MAATITPYEFDRDLLMEPMEVTVVGDEVVLNGGVHTIVFDASSALETGSRLIIAAARIQGAK